MIDRCMDIGGSDNAVEWLGRMRSIYELWLIHYGSLSFRTIGSYVNCLSSEIRYWNEEMANLIYFWVYVTAK